MTTKHALTFDVRARATDPISSHVAAEEYSKSERSITERQQALDAVRAYPGRTSRDLSMLTGLDRHMLARRLPEVEGLGCGPIVGCSRSRDAMRPWRLVDERLGDPVIRWWPRPVR